MQKSFRLMFSFIFVFVILSSTFFFQAAVGDGTSEVSPVVAIHISENTETHWANPSWTYFSTYRMLEEAFKADGTPFVEISDAQISSGQLLSSGTPRYPILFSLADECISDVESAQISSYAAAGGFVYASSSSWTRDADGSPRDDFALSSQMGLTCTNPSLNDWVQVTHVHRAVDNRLVNHVPKNVDINWRLPLTNHTVCSLEVTDLEPHYAWATHTTATDPAQVLMTTDGTVLLATKQYGNGMFIYHSELAPLASYSLYSPVAYEYMFFRQTAEWAFENHHVPLAKLSAWPYQYDSAFIVRHDMDISYQRVPWIVSSATAEKNMGVTGQYYIVTGDIRDASNSATLISLIQQANSLGAQIGSHNGGLDCTPWNASLHYGDYLFYHWGPDLAMNETGVTAGMAYANQSIKLSYDDLQGWLGQRPQIWVSPYGQSCWDESYQILDSLGIKTSGEFTTSPYPDFAFSVNNKTQTYNNYVVPFSRWINSSGFALQNIEDLNSSGSNDMQALVDFYYNMGAIVSPYSNSSSESGLPKEFIQDALAKPYMWNTTPTELWNWGLQRKQVACTEQFQTSTTGVNNLTVTLAGSLSANTALEIVLPINVNAIDSLQVLLNGVPTSNYRLTDSGLKVQAGFSSQVTVLYSSGASEGWTQTSQTDFKFDNLTGLDADTVPGQLTLAPPTTVFSDNFSDASWTNSHWTVQSGSWTVNNGYYNLVGQPGVLSVAYAGNSWSDYSVEARVRYVSGQYGGEISARLNSSAGSRYSFVLCPNGAGPNRTSLIKFASWQDTVGVVLGDRQVTTDTNWHNLRMELIGSHIKCFYDGGVVFDVVDSSYPAGWISFESYGVSTALYDWVNVTTLPFSGTLGSSPFDSGSDLVNWHKISWMASTPSGTSLQFRTRTASTQSGLASAAWSSYYSVSGSTITSTQQRWIQYEATLTTSDAALTPVLYGVTVTYNYTVPDGRLWMSLHIDMTATVGEPVYTETAITKPIEGVWTANDGTVYASSNQMLYKSLDQGVTWQQLRNFSSGVNSVFVDSRGYVYASTDQLASASNNGLWRSIDNGVTWTRVLAMPISNSIWGLDENSSGSLFAGVYTEGSTTANASILRSTDGGDNWVTVYYNSTARHVHDVTVDKTTNYIYASVGDKIAPWSIAYVLRSTDGGSTWSQIRIGSPQFLAIEAVSGARLFATDDPVNGAIYRTTDDQNFAEVLDTGGHSYGFWMRTNSLNGRIYASFIYGERTDGTNVARMYTSDDDGLTWQSYRNFTVSTAYCGSPSASNFVNGVMYYSVRLDSDWQNGIKISSATVSSSSSLSMDANTPDLAPKPLGNETSNTFGETNARPLYP